MFRSEIGSGFEDPGDTPPPRIPRSTPPPGKNHTLWDRTYLYSPYMGVPLPPLAPGYINSIYRRLQAFAERTKEKQKPKKNAFSTKLTSQLKTVSTHLSLHFLVLLLHIITRSNFPSYPNLVISERLIIVCLQCLS